MHTPKHHTVRASRVSGTGQRIGKLDCFIRFDAVTFWLSRTRDLVAGAETYSYPSFWEAFRRLRRKSRKAEFALVLSLYQFQRNKEKEASETNRQ